MGSTTPSLNHCEVRHESYNIDIIFDVRWRLSRQSQKKRSLGSTHARHRIDIYIDGRADQLDLKRLVVFFRARQTTWICCAHVTHHNLFQKMRIKTGCCPITDQQLSLVCINVIFSFKKPGEPGCLTKVNY